MSWKGLLLVALVVHYSVFLGMVIYGHPEKEVSVGLHEPIGPCDSVKPVKTILGMVLKKKEFLCPTKYDEGYFDFHCVAGGPPKGKATWYTICGTPFKNRVEYIAVISAITTVALGVFWNIYFNLYNNKNQLPSVVKKHKNQ